MTELGFQFAIDEMNVFIDDLGTKGLGFESSRWMEPKLIKLFGFTDLTGITLGNVLVVLLCFVEGDGIANLYFLQGIYHFILYRYKKTFQSVAISRGGGVEGG